MEFENENFEEELKDDVFSDVSDDESAAEDDGIHIHIPAPVVAIGFAGIVIGIGKAVVGFGKRIGSAIFGKKYAEVPPVRLKRNEK